METILGIHLVWNGRDEMWKCNVMKPFPLNSRSSPSKRWEQRHMFRGNYTHILLVLAAHLWDWELIWREIIKLTIFLWARHPFNPPPNNSFASCTRTPWSTDLGLGSPAKCSPSHWKHKLPGRGNTPIHRTSSELTCITVVTQYPYSESHTHFFSSQSHTVNLS